MSASTPSSPRVLLVTAGVGAGHNAVAHALEEGIRERWPSVGVRIVDALELEPIVFGPLMRQGNILGMTRLPRLYGAIYRATDRNSSGPPTVGERARHFMLSRMLRRLRRVVADFRPHLVIHTHWCGVPAVSRACLADEHMEQAVVVTDVIAHRYWFAPSVDRWFVAAPESVEKLRAWGISPERITVSGIPVHRAWEQSHSPEETLRSWSLPAEKPVVLLTGGATYTVGSVPSLAERLHETCGDASIVVLCGTNRPLEARIKKLAARMARLSAVPFTDRVHELVSASSLFVTKSGGITTAECLAAGTPTVLLPPVPGQEAENAEWLQSHRAAVVARDEIDVVGQVNRLLADESARRLLAESARALHRPGRETVVAWVAEKLGLG